MENKLAIMQPYLFPYIGYFQLINSVDEFVIYDNIKYTKKGFINRNKILSNNIDKIITVPIKKDSDYLDVRKRELATSWGKDRKKMLNLINSSYRKANYFEISYPLIEECIMYSELNLFKFIHNSVIKMCDYLNIKTKITISSTIDINHTLKSQDKVIAICKSQNATTYINSIGGTKLYSQKEFNKNNIKLNFIKSGNIQYKQFGSNFIPWLSIIDLIMFNSKEQITQHLNNYTLI